MAKTGTGSVPSPESMKKIREQMGRAVAFVRSRETTKAISTVSFNELISYRIREIEGDDSHTLRDTETRFDGGQEVKVPVRRAKIYGRYLITELDRITALENTIFKLIDGLKKIDPAAFVAAYRGKNDG